MSSDSSHHTMSFLPVPRLHLQKGLPGRIDIGAMFSSVPDSNIKVWGAELNAGGFGAG